MGKFSSNVGGKVLDWHWKKRKTDTLFFVGDILVGVVYNMGREGWSTHHIRSTSIGLADGFKTRYAASHFLLKFEERIKY